MTTARHFSVQGPRQAKCPGFFRCSSSIFGLREAFWFVFSDGLLRLRKTRVLTYIVPRGKPKMRSYLILGVAGLCGYKDERFHKARSVKLTTAFFS